MSKSIDRNISPSNGVFQASEIPLLSCRVLDNGMKLNYLRTAVEGLVRVDLVVRAGSAFQPRPMVAQLTNLLLKEGCREVHDANDALLSSAMDASQVAEWFDGYGAYVYYSTMMEYVIVTVCTPTKYIRENISLLRNLYAFPSYPEQGLKLNLQLREQQWRIDCEKVQVMASMKMNEVLFGSDHPYGRMLREEDFKALTNRELHSFHDRFYTPDNTCVVVTGDVDDDVIECIGEIFGRLEGEKDKGEPLRLVNPRPSLKKEWFIPKKGASQAAVRLSLPTIGEKHPDFHDLQILNALFGGYFGSRLMMSLREQKGYTYGIYSTHTVYNNFSYIDIETQTAIANVRPLIDGIYEEMDKLACNHVSYEELSRLRNYLYGEYVRMTDGPFSLSDLYVSSLTSGQEMAVCHKRQLAAIRDITPERLQQLAGKYLHREDFYLVCVGLPD